MMILIWLSFHSMLIIPAGGCKEIASMDNTRHNSRNFALLAFVFIRTWTKLLRKAGFVSSPFTPQENTVIQTCAVACYSIAVGGGFGSYLLGLNKKTYEQAGIYTEGNSPGSYKEPGVGWMTDFLFVSSFIRLLALFPLRKEIGSWVTCVFTGMQIFLEGFLSTLKCVIDLAFHHLASAVFVKHVYLSSTWVSHADHKSCIC